MGSEEEEKEKEESAETALPCKAPARTYWSWENKPELLRTTASSPARRRGAGPRRRCERQGQQSQAQCLQETHPERLVSPDPCNQLSLELLSPGRAPVPLLGCPQQNPPGLPGSSTAGILLRGLCVMIFTVLSDSLLGRLVVSCSGITAFGSGEGRDR